MDTDTVRYTARKIEDTSQTALTCQCRLLCERRSGRTELGQKPKELQLLKQSARVS
jgi:hypothetical protein